MMGRSGQKKRTTKGSASGYRMVQEAGLRSLQQDRWRALVVTVAFVALVAAMTQRLTPERGVLDVDVASQTIAPDTVRVEFGFDSVDLQQTHKAQEEAAAKVPETYRIDYAEVEQQVAAFRKQVEALRARRDELDKAVRKALLASDSSESAAEVVDAAVLAYASKLLKEETFAELANPALLAVWLRPAPASVPERRFESVQGEPPAGQSGVPESLADQTETARRTTELAGSDAEVLEFAHLDLLRDVGEAALRSTLAYGILSPEQLQVAVERDPDRRIVILREHPLEEQKVSEELSLRNAPVMPAAREHFAERIKENVQALVSEDTETPVDWASLENAAFEMAAPFLENTLVFDQVTTEGAREAARRAVEPIPKSILAGSTIQEGGYEWTEQSRYDFKTYMDMKMSGQQPTRSILFSIVSNMIIAGLVLACLIRSLKVITSRRRAAAQSIDLALLVMVATAIIARIVSYFDPTGFSVPVAAGAILLAILANARVASITSFLTAIILSTQFNYSWQLLVVSSAMAFAGLLGIYRVRKRSDMGGAAVKATMAGVAAMLAITLANATLFSEAALRNLGLVILNGLVCMFLVPGLLSPLERLFGITTDIQLLEYSDLNNEVLSRLAVEVPATHAHSLRVGELAEAACDAVGANGLLARVCAFYHDIGKLRRPQYFSENQSGANVHDELSPRLSARAIASHVMEGAEMAREFHLPKPIADAILEHHGTCMISFFYREAVAQQKHGDVQEEDFRYPGPKPQSRENAILMICDAVESGVRSIKNPNEDRVRELVDKIVSGRAADRQFDECDLTLRELDLIGDVVARRAWSYQHRRVEYPDETPQDSASNVIPMGGRPNA